MAENLKGCTSNFVSAVSEEPNCLVCHRPLKGPVKIRDCGHKVCLKCMVDDVLKSPKPICPKDKMPITDIQTFTYDCEKRDKINTMLIKCPNKNCTWAGEVLHFENHVLFECKEKPSNDEYGDETERPRQDKMENPPPKACSEDHGMVPCDFKGLGCQEKIKKSELEGHLKGNMKQHLKLACQKLEQQEEQLQLMIIEQTKELVRVETDLERVMAQLQSEKSKSRFTWHISLLKSRILVERRLFSESFFLRGYKMILFLTLACPCETSTEHLSVGFHIIRGKFDKELKWPFRRKVILTFGEVGQLPGSKPLTKVCLQPESAIKMPEGQIDDKMVVRKPMRRLASLSLLRDNCSKYAVSVELAADRE